MVSRFNNLSFLSLELRDVVYTSLHDDLGRQSRDRTTSLIKQGFYWPGIDAYLKERVQNCDRCINSKAGQRNTAELVNHINSSNGNPLP